MRERVSGSKSVYWIKVKHPWPPTWIESYEVRGQLHRNLQLRGEVPAPTDYDRGTDDCQSGSRKDDKLEIRTYSFDVREVHIPPSFRSLGSCDNHIMLDRETGGDIHSERICQTWWKCCIRGNDTAGNCKFNLLLDKTYFRLSLSKPWMFHANPWYSMLCKR